MGTYWILDWEPILQAHGGDCRLSERSALISTSSVSKPRKGPIVIGSQQGALQITLSKLGPNSLLLALTCSEKPLVVRVVLVLRVVVEGRLIAIL